MTIEKLGSGSPVQFLTLQDLYRHLRITPEDEDDIENDELSDLVKGCYISAVSTVETILSKSLDPVLYRQTDCGYTIELDEANVKKESIVVKEGNVTLVKDTDYKVIVNRETTLLEFTKNRSVTVDFECGYTSDTIPATYLRAIIMLTAEMFEMPAGGKELRSGVYTAVERLLMPTRRF